MLFNRRKQTKERMPGQVYDLYDNMLSYNHILIAGSTGSGKSVVVNALLYTALHYKPSEKQFILLDPKRVELKTYANCPHTIRRETETEGMIDALKQSIAIMENRYKYMEKHNLKLFPGSDIYVICDEFADLMTTSKKDCEKLFFRLAQLGRACKIHLILCTQRPTAKIIDGTIKVNIDYRLALRCPTRQDSRNILNYPGAETLPKFGYGYLLTPDFSLPTLFKIPMIAEDDILQAIDYWKA